MTPRPTPTLPLPSDAALVMPGSKSEANRLLACAALSPFAHELRGLPDALDVQHMVRGLRTLGYAIDEVPGAAGVVQVGATRDANAASGELFCGNAGTAIRFLTAVAAVTPGEWTLTGDPQLAQRPLQPIVDALASMGTDARAHADGLPLRVPGGAIDADEVTVDVSVSSQFASALMLIAPALPQGLTVHFSAEVASRRYLDLTCRALRRAGARASLRSDHVRVEAGFAAAQGPLEVTGDWSAMGVWTCLNHLTGSRIHGDRLVTDSDQADEALARVLQSLDGSGERVVDVEPLPDQFLNLAVVAALREGVTHVRGAANVRTKECDRVAVMARELRRCGVDLDEHEDGLTVRGGRGLSGAVIDPAGDHRVAIAMALLGCFVEGVAIEDPDCVRKSYPTFWEDLDVIRAEHRAVALVGMRGAGKSTLGRALAEHLGSRFVDADSVFEARNGPIAAFVERHGWPAFRHEEAVVLAEALSPGRVIATGGGVVETGSSLELLRANSVVVHVDAPVEQLRARIAGSGRPSLTGAPVTEELDAVLERRHPLYRQIAHRTVDATLSPTDQLQAALRGEA